MLTPELSLCAFEAGSEMPVSELCTSRSTATGRHSQFDGRQRPHPLHITAFLTRYRLDGFVEVVDLEGRFRTLAPGTCEVEEHHAYVVLRLGSDERAVRISHRHCQSLFATRQVVYVSW